MPRSVSRVSSASSILEPPPGHSDEQPEWVPTSGEHTNLSASSTLQNDRHTSTAADREGERAPLLGEARTHAPTQEHEGVSDEFSSTKSIWYLILLTVSIAGLQIAWSVELSNGSPYLLSLGVSKSLMALVWIAGPLSGTLVQPYVGMLSDNCTISWGKRKPFIVGGALATSVSLLMLAWTKEIVGGLLEAFGADYQSHGAKVAIIIVAVVWVYILDFAINTVQAAIRAFIVDCAPPQQQEAANAMASRFIGVGNIFGYVAGYLNLPQYLWFLGDTQFKILCAVASIALCGTVLLSVFTIKERNPKLDGPRTKDQPGLFKFFFEIFTSIKRLPRRIKQVCLVEVFAWIGFFPMLFYTSEYIGEIYAEPKLEENPHMTPGELDELYEEAVRVGTLALLIFAITSLITNVVLPFFIAPTYDGLSHEHNNEADEFDGEDESKSFLDYFIIPGFTLRRAWLLSQILFAICMICTLFVRSIAAATALISLVGITWAMTLWAPWAILSGEISRRDAALRARKQHRSISAGHDQGHHPDDEEDADKAGVILGIHNMSIAAPQVLATIGSSIVFKLFQKPRGTPGDHSIPIVFALGGIFVLISAYLIHRIEEVTPEEMLAAVEEGAAPDTPVTPTGRRKGPEKSAKLQRRALIARHSSFGTGLHY